VLVAGAVLDGRSERDIRALLEHQRVGSALREAGPGELWLTAAALQTPSRAR
jgi:hypothetical protein